MQINKLESPEFSKIDSRLRQEFVELLETPLLKAAEVKRKRALIELLFKREGVSAAASVLEKLSKYQVIQVVGLGTESGLTMPVRLGTSKYLKTRFRSDLYEIGALVLDPLSRPVLLIFFVVCKLCQLLRLIWFMRSFGRGYLPFYGRVLKYYPTAFRSREDFKIIGQDRGKFSRRESIILDQIYAVYFDEILPNSWYCFCDIMSGWRDFGLEVVVDNFIVEVHYLEGLLEPVNPKG